MSHIDTPDESAVPKGWRPKLRIWLMLLLFVPVAIVLRLMSQTPGLIYSENRSGFIHDDDQEILFSKLPDGTAPSNYQKIDTAYQSVGVSFSFGSFDEVSGMETNNLPLARTSILSSEGELHQGNLVNEAAYKSLSPPKSLTQPIQETGLGKSYIATSTYGFSLEPSLSFQTSACCRQSVGSDRERRFKGAMTIRFHQIDNPEKPAGVYRVGFAASRLDTAHTLRARLYTPNGRFIGSQTNLNAIHVFMSFESKYPIGWIEIESVGADQDYAIGNLMFGRLHPVD